MRSFLLDARAYRQLLGVRVYRDFLTQLADLGYRDLVEKAGYHDPMAFERGLFEEGIGRLKHIARMCSRELRPFLHLLLERREVERLKTVIRVWHQGGGGEPWISREEIVYPLSIDRLLSAPTLDAFLSHLENTPFHTALLEAKEAFDKHPTVFVLELGLDQDLVRRMRAYAESTHAKDRRIIHRLVGLEIDLRNLTWIGRFRTYYRMTSAEIVQNLLPWGYRFNTQKLHDLVVQGKTVSVIREFSPGLQALFSGGEDERRGFEGIERFLVHLLLEEARRAFMAFPFSIGSMLGYDTLLRIEERNLRILAEGIRYGLPSKEIESYLVF